MLKLFQRISGPDSPSEMQELAAMTACPSGSFYDEKG
jgi:hypothetical protein